MGAAVAANVPRPTHRSIAMPFSSQSPNAFSTQTPLRKGQKDLAPAPNTKGKKLNKAEEKK